jgi:hypothetical protein
MDGDKKRHFLLPPPFRTLSLAISPGFMDSALVFGVLDQVKPVFGKPSVLPHPG